MVNCTTKWWLCAAPLCLHSVFFIIIIKEYLQIAQDMALMSAHCHIDVLCQQTQIYEAEYETEHNDHKNTLQENRRLRKKREEMRQQVALLQEQVVFQSPVDVHTVTHTHTHTHTRFNTIIMCLSN